MFLFYVIITNTMAYWYNGAALAATRSPVIALFWCLIKFTTTTTTTTTTTCCPYRNAVRFYLGCSCSVQSLVQYFTAGH